MDACLNLYVVVWLAGSPTQEELDAKLAAMEAEIAHGQLELREEKQMVRDISRLKSQRDRVREAEGRHAAVGLCG